MIQKKTLVFDDLITGHHVEYLTHCFNYAKQNKTEQFVFAISSDIISIDFKSFSNEKHPNIELYYLHNFSTSSNVIIRALQLSMKIKDLAKQFNVTHVFLIMLMSFIPWLPFIVSRKYKVSGVIYYIYIYHWKKFSLLSKFQNILKYLLLSRFNCFEKIFILNDQFSVDFLNKKFKTKKFIYLSDPIFPIKRDFSHDLRIDLNIPLNHVVVLHMGSMIRNKGTLLILEMIKKFQYELADSYTFIFAGQVQNDIKEQFYTLFYQLKDNVKIIVFDEFCSESLIGSLCLTTDLFLCPYLRTSQSSGIIGFAAQFEKPVIVPKDGLLGKIVKRNDLGILLPDITIDSIFKALKRSSHYKKTGNYLRENTVLNFVNQIFK